MDTKPKPNKKLSIKHATATSVASSISTQPNSTPDWQPHPANNPEHTPKHDTSKQCSSSRRRGYRWMPWVNVAGLIPVLHRRFPDVSLNRVVNEGFLLWLKGCSESELRLHSRLARLCEEEHELMQTGRVILRSGAYLDPYAAKLIEGNEKLSVKLGRLPLGALADKREVNVVLRLLKRREAIVQEILEIENELLPKDEYVLKGERGSRSHRRDKTESIDKGGED